MVALRDPSDCLAPPYSVTEDMNGAKTPVKTCYKCKEDGHVRFALFPLSGLLAAS